MDWKEFFKLNMPKLIITIIFTILAFLVWFKVLGCATGSGCTVTPVWNTIFDLLFAPAFIPLNIGLAITLLLEILYLYLISCIIMFIYNQIKKK